MVGTSVVLLTVAILFLRNQIRPDPAARRGRRRLRQGPPRAARLPPARRARGAAGGAGVPGDARAHPPPRRAAHDHAGRRQPRPAHGADPLQAGAGAAAATARRSQALRNDVNEMQQHARGLPGLRQGRRRRGGGSRPTSASCWARCRRRPSTWAPRSRSGCASPGTQLVLPLKRQAFKRAVTNLVTNAARFGDYVVIRAAADDTWLRVEVDDDGPGIPPAELDNVFRPVLPARSRAATRTRATAAWGWPLPATSPAAMAATWRSASAPWAACAPPSGCRSSAPLAVVRCASRATAILETPRSCRFGFSIARPQA